MGGRIGLRRTGKSNMLSCAVDRRSKLSLIANRITLIISVAKKKDLMDLVKEGAITASYGDFYESLITVDDSKHI